MKTCDFCEIASDPARVISRNKLITSFLSNPRLARAHTLIIPNRHLTLPDQMSADEILATSHEASRIRTILLGSVAMGVDTWQKSRPFVAEGVIKRDHLHTHVLPSSPGEVLYDRAIDWGGDGWAPLAEAERNEILALLRP